MSDNLIGAAILFAVVAVIYSAAHQVGDYWVQTDHQAQTKGQPGWTGRRACLGHVATYTLTLAVPLAAAAWWLALPLHPSPVLAGLAVSAISHYVADRRTPLQALARALGKEQFWQRGKDLGSGAAHLDQAWHRGWLLVAALITTGLPH